jgi:hypothetical protein
VTTTALECKKGGRVISLHNEIRDELSDPASKARSPSAFATNQKIVLVASSKSSLLCLPARVTYVRHKKICRKLTQTKSLKTQLTFRRHLTMAVFDLAEISSVLGIDCADLSSVVAMLSVDVLGFT